jgi:hypothetical protein
MRYPEELKQVARRVIWFGTPEEALGIRHYFLTYLMNYGSDSDVEIARKYYSDEDFQDALDRPAPGIFFPDAWVKWNTRYKRIPIPPLPKRCIPGVDPKTIPDFFPAKVYISEV